MKPRLTDSYPSLYYQRLRRMKRQFLLGNFVVSAVAIGGTWGYFQGWPGPFWEFAPYFWACFLFYFWGTVMGFRASKSARVLPYFKKAGERVKATTFLSGQAIARHFEAIEALLKRGGCEPLSTFGFEDDLAGENVTWHDARRGIQVVATLLEKCQAEITQLEGVENDLLALQLALEDAQSKEVPFCLLLRHGDSWSGAELDARQGSFGT